MSSTSIRIRGALMMACGAILVSMMGYITWWMMSPLNDASHPGGSRFTGTREQLMMIYGLFGLVIIFGSLSLLLGLWQLVAGRRSKVFVRILIGVSALLYAFAIGVYWILGK